MHSVDDILKERQSRYGDFTDNAEVSQSLKDLFRDCPAWETMPDFLREAFDGFALKASRALTGDPSYPDNYIDIIGNFTLVLERLNDTTTRNP